MRLPHEESSSAGLSHGSEPHPCADGKTLVGLEYLQNLVRAREGARAGPSGIQVILASQMPTLEYDAVRKQFHASSAQPHLFGEAKVRGVPPRSVAGLGEQRSGSPRSGMRVPGARAACLPLANPPPNLFPLWRRASRSCM